MIEVVLRETQKIYGLSKDEKEFIKQELTLPNPDYQNAVRYSKRKVVYIPKYLFFFENHADCLEVPQAYTLPDLKCVKNDRRTENPCSYPPFVLKLRETQKEAFKAYLEDTDKGVISMPTGKGKSILGIYCAFALRQKALVIVNKDDLVDTWIQDIGTCFDDKVVSGLVKASKRKVGEQITITTIQTLNSMAKRDLDSFNEFVEQFGMVIVDEMHHISSSIYDLINHFPAQYKIGLSATPERSDGLTKVMHWYLGDLCFDYEYTEEDTDILPCRVEKVSVPLVFMPQAYKMLDKNNEVKYVAEQYVSLKNRDSLQKVPYEDIPQKKRPKFSYMDVENSVLPRLEVMDLVCEKIEELYKQGRNILVFFSQKYFCSLYRDHLVDVFGFSRKSVAIYNGDISKKQLPIVREGIEKGEFKVTFATYSIAKEGTNVKAWDTALLVSSINDEKNVEQAAGRVRRSKEGKPDTALIVDFRYPEVFMFKNHGYARDRRYTKLGFISRVEKPKQGYRKGYQSKM